MYTQCPRCLTVFTIEDDALQASLGIVDCSQCGRRFNALLPPGNAHPSDRDPRVERHQGVPTLTETGPPSSGSAVPPRGHEGVVAPLEGETTPSEAATAGDAAALEPGMPDPDGGSDWFAELETELTGSLRPAATSAAPEDALGDHAWQVDDLPVENGLPEPATPVTFGWAGPGFGSADVLAGPDWGTGTFGPNDSGISESPGSVTPADARGSRETTDAGPASHDEAAQQTEQVPPISADEPIGAGQAPPAHGEPPRANRLLAHAADDEAPERIDEPPTSSEAEAAPDSVEPPAPLYVRPRKRPRAATVACILGSVVLAIVLAGQLAWIKRVDLFRNPATHAWTVRACQAIDCRLPPIRDVAKLELVSRDVRPDPRAPGALMITATLRNDAGFRQPWPVVVVELTDLDDNTVAMRRFLPAEYMPDAARRADGIAAGATSAIAFEVADPGRRAVAFRFSFE